MPGPINIKLISNQNKQQFENDLQTALIGIWQENLIDIKYSTHGIEGMPIVHSALIIWKIPM